MRFDWDPAKNDRTMQERGFDFAYAARMFEGAVIGARDERRDYGEERWIGIGRVAGRMMVIGYTWRGDVCWIFSARKANQREVRRYEAKYAPAG